MKRVVLKYYSILTFILLVGCVEEYNYIDKSFDATLIVEATITDELKHQEIFLSRAHKFNEERVPESSATIKVNGDDGSVYLFSEIAPGNYISNNFFSAKENVKYHLELITSEGETVISTSAELSGVKNMDDVFAEVTTDNITGDLGIGVFINTNDVTGSSKYFRYEFIETDKVILPYWSNKKLFVLSYTPPAVEARPKNYEDRVCYRTKKSSKIIQTDLINVSTTKVDKFRVNFIKADDYKTIYGYSILVKQYVQSDVSYNYYKTLSKFSSSNNVLSQVQPGFINGNLTYVNDSKKQVIGLFDVSAYSEKRIFFKYKDLFPDSPFPKFKEKCFPISPELSVGHYPETFSSPLIEAIKEGKYVYYFDNPDSFNRPYTMVPIECSDCRVYGTTEKPDFWID